jgi:hypothetical protein
MRQEGRTTTHSYEAMDAIALGLNNTLLLQVIVRFSNLMCYINYPTLLKHPLKTRGNKVDP